MIDSAIPRMTQAITRAPSSAMAACELTFVTREPINLPLALLQHEEYIRGLEWLGLRVTRLPALEAMADACFVEDVAIIVEGRGIITRPGAASRRDECLVMERDLRPLMPVHRIDSPATIEGGDVLRIGARVFVGRSSRTSDAGITAITHVLSPLGYSVIPVRVDGCLHLKTACTALDSRTLLANPAWIDTSAFPGFRMIHVPEDEPWAGNTLVVNGRALVHQAHRGTADLVARSGLEVRLVDISEFLKAEAGLTCLSVVW